MAKANKIPLTESEATDCVAIALTALSGNILFHSSQFYAAKAAFQKGEIRVAAMQLEDLFEMHAAIMKEIKSL